MTAALHAARSWLAAEAGDDVPAALMQRMNAALDEVQQTPGADVPDALAAAAMSCLRDALQRCDHRDAALHLLAADALMTAACQAAAETSADRLRTLTAAYDVARLAAHAANTAGAGA